VDPRPAHRSCSTMRRSVTAGGHPSAGRRILASLSASPTRPFAQADSTPKPAALSRAVMSLRSSWPTSSRLHRTRPTNQSMDCAASTIPTGSGDEKSPAGGVPFRHYISSPSRAMCRIPTICSSCSCRCSRHSLRSLCRRCPRRIGSHRICSPLRICSRRIGLSLRTRLRTGPLPRTRLRIGTHRRNVRTFGLSVHQAGELPCFPGQRHRMSRG
jgi:hypothetical protein